MSLRLNLGCGRSPLEGWVNVDLSPLAGRADYGYRGDWEPSSVTLLVPRAQNQGPSAEAILQKVQQFRNVVLEVVAVLEAIKPIRAPDRALLSSANVILQLV